MKLLIVSDSHGLHEELKQLKERYEKTVDAMIHCGDSELMASDDEIKGFLIVRGNCDYDKHFPLDILQNIDGNNIFITHGHHYNVKMTLLNLSYKAKEVAADFVFFGHSHTLGAEMINGTLFLNPGSFLMPRGRKDKTYAIVEKNENIITTKFFNHNDEELVELRQTFNI
ncbi:metallophosphoesterase [Heyndrickxia sp. NPDC080065]|uniref:metallophosphoesterase n=1 Tax=Heyndrickxia sp. NPDC080065 TaxID=3390568 RepID=UPI003CFCD687